MHALVQGLHDHARVGQRLQILYRSDDFVDGYFYPLTGVTLSSPIALTGTTVGLTFNIQGSTDGVTFTNVNSLTSLVAYGDAPTVGSTVFNGYYRNANSETNGNFTSSLRTLGNDNESLGVTIYGTVAAAVP